MKNLIPFLIFFLLESSFVYSQVSFGVKAGVNIDYLIPEKDQVSSLSLTTTSGTGFHIGGFSKLKITKAFFFIPELQFIHKKMIDGNGNDSGKLTANYLEVPLLISYAPVRIVNFDLGPGVNYAMSSTYELLNRKSKEFLKKVDIGINAGVRMNITSSIAVIGRYYHGLINNSKITVYHGPTQYESSNFKNSTIEMSLAYTFR